METLLTLMVNKNRFVKSIILIKKIKYVIQSQRYPIYFYPIDSIREILSFFFLEIDIILSMYWINHFNLEMKPQCKDFLIQ